MYVNIPVKQETKKLLDTFRKIWKTRSYDETIKKLAKANSYALISDL